MYTWFHQDVPIAHDKDLEKIITEIKTRGFIQPNIEKMKKDLQTKGICTYAMQTYTVTKQ